MSKTIEDKLLHLMEKYNVKLLLDCKIQEINDKENKKKKFICVIQEKINNMQLFNVT